ncbi:MAG TPA: pitrilysin family protein [Gemmatimonadaceae bacterium]|nr:pitrilysin family protein [Gemmatimonadaceae bacterium]
MTIERKTGHARHASGRGWHDSRRERVRAVLAVIAGVCLLSPPARAQKAELERFIHQKVLANGLTVIAVENHGVPLVTLEAVVRNGAFTQTPETEGLAHLYEHMFFKANEAYPDPDGVMARASLLGAIFNAETREEEVNYYLTLPSDSVEGGLQLLSSALRTPQFLPTELALEKQVVLGEYDRAESEAGWHLDQAMMHLLWGTAFSRKNTIGSRSVLQRVTSEQMRAIQHRYYVPNNTAIIVAGDIAPAEAFARAEKWFGSWARAADPFASDPMPPVPPLARDAGTFVEQDVGGAAVVIQWQGPSLSADPQSTFVADVFSDYLNLPGSEFQQKLVDTGLWQGRVVVNYYTLNHVGPITVSGQTSPEKLREAIPALMRELKRAASPGYFTADKLEEVKAHRATDSEFSRERTSGFSHALGFWWSVIGLDYYFRYLDEMARQKSDDLVRYFRTYVLDKPHVTGVLLSPAARRATAISQEELVRLAAWQ